MDSSVEHWIERLEKHLESLPLIISGIDEGAMSHRPAPGKWSKREILGHLIDSAVNNHQRFIRIQFEPEPFRIEPYAQDEWVARKGYQDLPTALVLDWWTSQNRQIAHLMRCAGPDTLQRQCRTPGGGLYTFQWLFEDYVVHLEHHLRQILAGVEKPPGSAGVWF